MSVTVVILSISNVARAHSCFEGPASEVVDDVAAGLIEGVFGGVHGISHHNCAFRKDRVSQSIIPFSLTEVLLKLTLAVCQERNHLPSRLGRG